MAVPITYFASIHYNIYVMLKATVDYLTREGSSYENTKFEIINLDHIEGLPDTESVSCFLGYSIKHNICKQSGTTQDESSGFLNFMVGTPKPENEQQYFSENHICIFYEALEKFSSLFCTKAITIDGEELDTALLRYDEIDEIQTTSEKGYILSDALLRIVFSPDYLSYSE